MDLIDDLDTDIAVAILVEKRHRQRLDERDALDLISRITNALQPLSQLVAEHHGRPDQLAKPSPLSH